MCCENFRRRVDHLAVTCAADRDGGDGDSQCGAVAMANLGGRLGVFNKGVAELRRISFIDDSWRNTLSNSMNP